ncbi:atrophin-1 isoform X2 [Acyrthosiphon pisum]|uniref:Uncharacterized protein n=1 Tax=Acyrthosiphon pisum TaxID=7029 RepID=A0A8R2H5R7_ACYPI|nr:atrophin-1 isoform X2 [Acyrthosiphon pisum]|eukprot:XP_016661597.1 PREDICTED: atrophin-1 isoform X2 [Acyrthosiphon pisum]
MRCSFVAVGVLVLKIIVVGAAETAPESQAPWTHKDTASTGKTMTDGRNVISPRMDFEEWTPLGRGDPLKNDPTFDYLPPVLDRVHYWKSPPAATNRAHYYSSVSTAMPTTPPSQAVHGGYNRRFFLTDFSKREPVQAASYAAIKRPPPNNNIILQPHHHHTHNHHHAQQQQMQHHLQTLQAVSAAGYHYSMHPAAPVPRTPLPMLTPPPYQQWPAAVDGQRQSLSLSSLSSSSSSPDLPGNAVAESKQPPPTMVRAPTRLVPASSHQSAVIKALLDDEVDRTTVTTTVTPMTGVVWMTTMMTTTTSTPPPPPPPPSVATTTTTTTPPPPTPPATSTAARATPPVAVTDPLFSHYRQSPVTGRPMYLIIQGHSKVKTYGLASKLDDLTAAPAVVQDHNHIGNQPPDEPSRRKRDHYRGTRR